MNNARRKSLNNINIELDMVLTRLKEIKQDLGAIQSDEEDAYDNMPESLQASDRGEASQEAQENLDSAISSLEDAIEYAEEAKG